MKSVFGMMDRSCTKGVDADELRRGLHSMGVELGDDPRRPRPRGSSRADRNGTASSSSASSFECSSRRTAFELHQAGACSVIYTHPRPLFAALSPLLLPPCAPPRRSPSFLPSAIRPAHRYCIYTLGSTRGDDVPSASNGTSRDSQAGSPGSPRATTFAALFPHRGGELQPQPTAPGLSRPQVLCATARQALPRSPSRGRPLPSKAGRLSGSRRPAVGDVADCGQRRAAAGSGARRRAGAAFLKGPMIRLGARRRRPGASAGLGGARPRAAGARRRRRRYRRRPRPARAASLEHDRVDRRVDVRQREEAAHLRQRDARGRAAPRRGAGRLLLPARGRRRARGRRSGERRARAGLGGARRAPRRVGVEAPGSPPSPGAVERGARST